MASLPPTSPQVGGSRMSVKDEISVMSGHFVLLFLVLVCVYVSRIPGKILGRFRSTLWQGLGLFFIIAITLSYGWIHGIMAALAFALVVSRAVRETSEGMMDYVPPLVFVDADNTNIVTDKHRWFVEKVLGENPFLLRESNVNTSAVQDLSERNMGNGGPSSK